MKYRVIAASVLLGLALNINVSAAADVETAATNATSNSAENNTKKNELQQLLDTTINLIEELVAQNVISREKADELIHNAKIKATQQQASEEQEVIPPGTVRVPYISQTVKDALREEVRLKVREDVSADIIAKAKQERWGIPNAWPQWIQRIKFYGDIRLRAQLDDYADSNVALAYFDRQANNEDGRVTNSTDAFLNTTEDRQRQRIRARFGIKAKVTEGWTAGLRLATGSFTDPVSTNQTLGNTNRNFRVSLDRAFLKYDSLTKFITVSGGRIPNPWLSSNLVWDKDLNFDGYAAKIRYARSDNPLDDEITYDPFLTIGIFPIGEFAQFSDKWLFGIQKGFKWYFSDQSSFSLGLAYYDFHNIDGKSNPVGTGSTENDFTAPDFLQKGNSLFDISDSANINTNRFALATDYDLINLTIKYDLAKYAPIHFYLTADYVKNIGYKINADAVASGQTVGQPGYAEESEGYQLKFAFGWPDVKARGNWQAYLAYKYLERDAVLDAFTDSDFHLGGTDAEGFEIGGSYGLTENLWLSARFISSDVINGEQYFNQTVAGQQPTSYEINTLQFDINAKF